MRALAIVALVVASAAAAQAQAAPATRGVRGGVEEPAWHVNGGVTGLVEAWDYNESRESLAGVVAGVDYRVWKALAARAEGLIVQVRQTDRDAWLRGFTVGARSRWSRPGIHPFVELAVGLSDSTRPVPPRGTRFNFLAVAGGGVVIPMRHGALEIGARWLHISNNGREGSHRNPDIQTLGVVVGIGTHRSPTAPRPTVHGHGQHRRP